MSYLNRVAIERDQNRNREVRRHRKLAEKKERHDAWLSTRQLGGQAVKYLGAYRETSKDNGTKEGPWLCKRCKEPLAKQGLLRILFKFTFGQRMSGGVQEHTIQTCTNE